MYRVIECPKCKTLQMSSALKKFSCVKCSKSYDIERMKVIFESRSPQECTEVLKKIKEEKAKKQKYFDDGFENAGY